MNADEYVCEHCGGRFESERDPEEAHAESETLWGTRGDAAGMAVVCDDCWRKFMAWATDRSVVVR